MRKQKQNQIKEATFRVDFSSHAALFYCSTGSYTSVGSNKAALMSRPERQMISWLNSQMEFWDWTLLNQGGDGGDTDLCLDYSEFLPPSPLTQSVQNRSARSAKEVMWDTLTETLQHHSQTNSTYKMSESSKLSFFPYVFLPTILLSIFPSLHLSYFFLNVLLYLLSFLVSLSLSHYHSFLRPSLLPYIPLLSFSFLS